MDSPPESEQERAEAVSRLYQQRMDEAIEHRNVEWELEEKHRKADERWTLIKYVLGFIIVIAGAISQGFSQVLPPFVLSVLGVLVVAAPYLSQRDDARGKNCRSQKQ
jgi:hypothetical protein